MPPPQSWHIRGHPGPQVQPSNRPTSSQSPRTALGPPSPQDSGAQGPSSAKRPICVKEKQKHCSKSSKSPRSARSNTGSWEGVKPAWRGAGGGCLMLVERQRAVPTYAM